MEALSKTIDRHTFFRVLGASLGVVSLSSCETKADDLSPASDALDLTIRLDDARYVDLLKQGFYVVVNNRVIVAHIQPNQYVAVSPKCTHEGSTLVYQANNNAFYCPLDGSRFDLNGKVIFGPATQPLVVYKVSNDQKSNTLRIFG